MTSDGRIPSPQLPCVHNAMPTFALSASRRSSPFNEVAAKSPRLPRTEQLSVRPQHGNGNRKQQRATAVALSDTGNQESGWRSRRLTQVVAASLAVGFGFFAAPAVWASVEVGDTLVGVPRVVDGDTLVVAGEKIRLFGLDAPETKQSCNDASGKQYACGEVATAALKSHIGADSLQCTVRAKDLYGRSVSKCSLPESGDIGDWLVKNGHAVAYRQYSKAYVEDEEAARSAKKGIWSGSFEEPAQWRRHKKASGHTPSGSAGRMAMLPKAMAAAPGCDIKGNVSAKGERIYHMPTGRYYENVKIEQSKGERMFCTEKAAQKAGFRRSKE